MGSSICKDCFKTVPTPPQQDHEMNNMPQNHLKPHPHRREVSRPVGITENVLYIEELNIEELKTLIEQIPFTLPQSFQFNFKPSPIKKRLHLKLKPNLIIKSPNLKLKSKKPKTKKKMDTIMEKPKKKISLKDIEISPLESSSAINLLRSFSFKPELESEILIYANNIILEQTESLWALNHNNPYQHIKLSEYEVLSLESPFSFKLQNKVSLQFFLLSIIQLPPEHSINLATLYSHCSIMEKIQEIKYYRAFASKIESIYTMDDSENFPKPIYAFKAVKLQTYGLCSVEDLLRKGYKFTPNQLTSFLKNISGLCYRSEKIGIANRMLIPSNFFLAEGLSDFRIFDYSLACDIGEEKFTKIKGWVKDFEDFWPPELVCFIGKESQAKYNPFLSDVYTLGLTLLCMMGVKRSELSFLKAKEMALEKKLKEYEENGFEDIIKQVRVMLNPKPEQRLSFFQIYENLKKVKSFFLGNLEVVQQIKAEEKEKDAEFFEKLGDLILLVHGETESLLAYDEALGIVTDSNIETKETNLLKIKLHEKIAKCYYRMEDYGSAIIHYIKIMDIQKTILNEEKDLETIRNSILLAQLRGLQMNYNMAGRIYYQSYNKMKELFENFSERPETIFIFKNFGEMLVRIQGLESFGLEFIYKSLELVVKIEGINSHLYFLVLNSIGGCFEIANSIRNASEIYQRIADEARVVYGKVHPLLSKMYGKLALAYQNQSDFQKATLFYKKNLGLQLKIYGENSLEVAENKLLLAKSYLQANEWKKPLKLLRER